MRGEGGRERAWYGADETKAWARGGARCAVAAMAGRAGDSAACKVKWIGLGPRLLTSIAELMRT